MEDELYSVHLEGNPDTESTRRHMERVLSGDAPRRWPWLLGLVAGGTALAFWRLRRTRRANGREDDRPIGRSEGLRFDSDAEAPKLRSSLSRATGR